jgi:hypothetical protein
MYMALRLARVTQRPGWVPNTDQFADALKLANGMLGRWNLGKMIYSSSIVSVPLVSGQKIYTLGPGGTINAARPEKITGAAILFPTGPVVRRGVHVTDDDSEWRSIAVQDIANGVPEFVYNDGASPLSTLYIYPQPGAGYVMEFYVWSLLAHFADLTDTVTLPEGYEHAITHSLACLIAAAWGLPVNPDVRAEAKLATAQIRSKNVRSPRMSTDQQLARGEGGGHYNYLSGLVDR